MQTPRESTQTSVYVLFEAVTAYNLFPNASAEEPAVVPKTNVHNWWQAIWRLQPQQLHEYATLKSPDQA